MARRLGRGISFGNVLDAPGAERFQLHDRYFDVVKAAGFDTVRLPVKWSARASQTPPYEIDPDFFQRVDWAIEGGLARGLNVVVTCHHYHELCDIPGEESPRFLALWHQIARRHAGRPESLYFELLNEPHDPMTAEEWNALLRQALTVVREADPTRFVIVGPTGMNGVEALSTLDVPSDPAVLATIHHYAPFAFTHQGAPWCDGAGEWLGTSWGSEEDHAAVRGDLERAAAWAAAADCPVFVGEFGTHELADLASRASWTSFVRSEAERLELSWAYWDFGSDFGAYDVAANAWREPLRAALLGD
jgi:endoglucanase